MNCKISFKTPANIYLFKVNDGYTRSMCEICSKFKIKAPERCHWHRSGVLTLNIFHISQKVLVSLLCTLNKQIPAGTTILTNICKQLLPCCIYYFNVNNENTRTISRFGKTPMLSLFLNSNIFKHCSSASIVEFKQVNTGWVYVWTFRLNFEINGHS